MRPPLVRPFYSFLFLLSFLFSGCSVNDQPAEMMATTEEAIVSHDAATPEASRERVKQPQRIIRQAEVKMEVKDVAASSRKIEALVEASGATVANSDQDQQEDTRTAEYVIKVQPEKFMGLLQQLQNEGLQVNEKTISTQDVALEYVDLQARRTTKLALEQRFLELLQQAKGINQILEVERPLQSVREEIESTEARLRYLQNQTAFSTIKLTIHQHLPATAPTGPGFGLRLLDAMSTGWQLLLSLLVAVVYIWPVWIVGALVLLYLRQRNLA